MCVLQRQALSLSTLLLILATPVLAQQNNTNGPPHIGYIYPAGGQQGTTFQVAIGGQFLQNVSDARVAGGGVEATIVKVDKPLTKQLAKELLEKFQSLKEKREAASNGSKTGAATFSDDDRKMLEELRKKLMEFKNKKNKVLSPSIAETAWLQVKIGPSAEVGPHELRLMTPNGLSNPMTFYVGQLPEFSETPGKSAESDSPMAITLPAVVNGQIMPGAVNRYHFKAHKGDHLVFQVRARDLIPYIADAVPGWFQASLGIYDSGGNELAYADHFRYEPDPVLYHEFAAEGEYTMEIKDSLYRGREDFVYRITAGELPYVTSIFPLGGRVGSQTAVELRGWNLPETHITPQSSTAGQIPICVHRGSFDSNVVPFVVDTLPECGEAKPNDSLGSAQPVALPIIINGRIDHPGTSGVYSFEGKAGEEVVAEVYARRLGSPLDSIVKLTDSSGKQLAENDDHDDKAAGLLTHQADSWLRTVLPAQGTYYLHISDAQHKGGTEYAYRLRISHPRPDFELRVTPSSINVHGGGTVPITVYAIRRDGFAKDITLDLAHAPAGCALVGSRIAAGQDMVKCTLTVPAMTASEPVDIQLEGHAAIDGRVVHHPAIAAEDMTQAFFYKHVVSAHEWLLDVDDHRSPKVEFKVASMTPVRIPAGGTARIEVAVQITTQLSSVEFDLVDPPDGLTIGSIGPTRNGAEIILQGDASMLKAGMKGNLIIDAFGRRAPQTSAKTGKGKASRRVPLGTLPAVPFEIVSR